MRQMRAWLLRLLGLFGRDRRDRELTDEIETHLQMRIADNVSRGMPAAEARRQALIEAGGIESAKELYRERRSVPVFETVLQDVRFAVRTLLKAPAFTLAAVIALALGIGANTGIFSLIHAVLLRPLPFPDADRLVTLWERRPESGEANIPISGFEFIAWHDQSHTFERLALYESGLATLTGRGEPESVSLLRVSGDFFSLWGVQPAVGRPIQSGEDHSNPEPIAILSDACW
ncbi:MAG TPA: permease prefix domain 1-containing protein, partial [Blastocatellia bacterium]|nr:permease prefix domain 1-containing protein [Blastocatellia bacterium]